MGPHARARGLEHLARSRGGISTYHLEASIAAEHALAASFEPTNWERIVRLYETREHTRTTNSSPTMPANILPATLKQRPPNMARDGGAMADPMEADDRGSAEDGPRVV